MLKMYWLLYLEGQRPYMYNLPHAYAYALSDMRCITLVLMHILIQSPSSYKSQHCLMSCMRMKTCMKMAVVWGYASGLGWCISCQSMLVRIWQIVHIWASGPRDREANQQVTEPSKVTGYEPSSRNHLSLLYKLYFYITIFQSLKNPNPYNYPWP